LADCSTLLPFMPVAGKVAGSHLTQAQKARNSSSRISSA
jgi:hypothetical protein